MGLVVNLEDSFDEMFRELMEKTNFRSEAEIIANALALLDLVCEAKEFGFRLAIVDKDGTVDDYVQGF
tara:strand:- start:231 stop:434 length:204 start_codon:yes stop_codon:yes gene_type:complete